MPDERKQGPGPGRYFKPGIAHGLLPTRKIPINAGSTVNVETRVKVMAMVTERVESGVAFMPFHFGGHMEGVDLRDRYPEGADPYVLGESTNTAQTYGYDSVTQMQETKATLCKIWTA